MNVLHANLFSNELEELFRLDVLLQSPGMFFGHVLIEILQDIRTFEILPDRLVLHRSQSKQFRDLRLFLHGTDQQLLIIILMKDPGQIRFEFTQRAHRLPVGIAIEVRVDFILGSKEIVDTSDLISTLNTEVTEILHAVVKENTVDDIVPTD